MSKQAGRFSESANDFLAPKQPTIGTATNVGTNQPYDNGSATVAFTPDPTYAATSFTVTSSPGGFTGTGTTSPVTVSGLSSNTAYTFTVVATNAVGSSPASASSNSVTITTVPATPADPVATGQVNQDSVTWSAPSADGGSPITGYTLISSDGPTYDAGTATSYTVPETANTSQSYTVIARNANGNSLASAASNKIGRASCRERV